MQTIKKIIAGAGFVSLMLGAAAADSEQLWIPAVMILLGILCCSVGAWEDAR